MPLSSRHEVTVEWGDCDPAGIVYYPAYFKWFDQATEAVENGWCYFQGSVSETQPFGGREQILFWEGGRGELVRSPGAYVKGTQAWGKEGVTVSQMRPPGWVYLAALLSRLKITCVSRVASPSTRSGFLGRDSCRSCPRPSTTGVTISTAWSRERAASPHRNTDGC